MYSFLLLVPLMLVAVVVVRWRRDGYATDSDSDSSSDARQPSDWSAVHGDGSPAGSTYSSNTDASDDSDNSVLAPDRAARLHED